MSGDLAGSAPIASQELAAIWATGPGLQRLSAVNHSVIGLRFITTAFVFFAIGGVLGMLTRAQLATPDATSWTRRPTTRSSPCTAR